MHFKMSFIPVAYKAKQNFQSSVDDPSEIILICWFGAQETLSMMIMFTDGRCCDLG